MKKLKEIIAQVKELQYTNEKEVARLLWQLICYSPKFPVRLQQQELLDKAEPFSLQVNDPHFSGSVLKFNGFKWGNGSCKVVITHGWGSKAADFADLINTLRTIENLQIIAFDAPGNGSSEGELSNLLLFSKATEAVIDTYGAPDILIGHSLGVMANVLAINNTAVKPSLLISIAPLVRLKENFIASMEAAGTLQIAQDQFFENFESLFEMQAAHFNLSDLYPDNAAVKHWLAYDKEDKTAPYAYLQEFLSTHPEILIKECEAVGHERIIKDAGMLEDILTLVRQVA
ncbi:alpha/beta fold hydrolase [Mucilaginibacter sp. SP1R1]|uniref:alpha/beta fold hydrolase n=1 Tax=Mucilaginibacter sp. SP1R1 TaxID=2723091 RepID=UPI001619FEC5|nr:alpha/beta hydrolase [Mucilaginibacter sp. SP1R1]MBB6151988.1 pimeloyl-ACP methyl ester carboxylesterase [Mucilaginibacter sp. SP1R1]